MNNNTASLLLLPTESSILFLDVSQIVRIKANSNYSRLYFSDNRFPLTVAKTLSWFEDRHVLSSFIRIHRGHLINPQHIKLYHIKFGLLLLDNKELLPVARRRKPVLKEQLIAFNHHPLSLNLLTEKTIAA